MIAVIFQADFANEVHRGRYLDIAGTLRPELDHIDGFLAIERFQSYVQPNRILSLSYWRDHQAIAHWRRHPEHLLAQQAGKKELFSAWSIRCAEILTTRTNGAT